MPEFRLSQLLRLRRLQEEQALADLGVAQGRARATEAATARARRALADLGTDATELSALRAIAAARSSSAMMLDELRERRGQDAAGIAAAEAGQREARIRARTLARLEDRWQRAEAEAELRREQAAVDEFAGSRPTETERGAVA